MEQGAEDVPVIYLHEIKRQYMQAEVPLVILDGVKLALVSMDSTLRSNLTVGLPIDLLVMRRNTYMVELRRRITADIRAVADDTIKDRLAITGQLLNVGGPEEFAQSIDEQRAKVAKFAKIIGVDPLPQN